MCEFLGWGLGFIFLGIMYLIRCFLLVRLSKATTSQQQFLSQYESDNFRYNNNWVGSSSPQTISYYFVERSSRVSVWSMMEDGSMVVENASMVEENGVLRHGVVRFGVEQRELWNERSTANVLLSLDSPYSTTPRTTPLCELKGS